MIRQEPTWPAGQNLAAAIESLYAAGHYDQVFVQATRGLEAEPESPDLHYYRGLASLHLKRAEELRSHIDFLLQAAPDDSRGHQLAALHELSRRKYRVAEKHIEEAINLYPTCSVYHRQAAAIAAAGQKLKKAEGHIKTALELDPQDADSIRFAVELRGLGETRAWQAWERIQRLTEALAIDPNNAEVHCSIGSVYLDDLDQPKEAEGHFREALRLDPRDRDTQKLLFRAVGKQRLIYRVISIPSRCFGWIGQLGQGLRIQPWRIIFVIFGFKLIAAGLVWLLAASLVFWPAGKIYEWLLLEETRAGAGTAEWHLRMKRLLLRWPFAVRFGIFAGIISIFWIVLFRYFADSYKAAIFVLGVFVGIHFFATFLSLGLKKMRAALGRRKGSEADGCFLRKCSGREPCMSKPTALK